MRAIHTGPWSITRGVATAALLAVAAFWTWFAAAAGVITGPLPEALTPVLLFVVPLLAAAAITTLVPRYGGYGLILAGAFAFWFFADVSAWLMLAMPLVLIGTALAIVGRRPHTPLHATSHTDSNAAD
jgi:hypothetical protein